MKREAGIFVKRFNADFVQAYGTKNQKARPDEERRVVVQGPGHNNKG